MLLNEFDAGLNFGKTVLLGHNASPPDLKHLRYLEIRNEIRSDQLVKEFLNSRQSLVSLTIACGASRSVGKYFTQFRDYHRVCFSLTAIYLLYFLTYEKWNRSPLKRRKTLSSFTEKKQQLEQHSNGV